MPKQTKAEKAKENIFTEKVAPLMDEIAELCDKHNFPLLIAVQLYVNKKHGARIAAQSIETGAATLPLEISCRLLRGEAKIEADSASFYITLTGKNDKQLEISENNKHLDNHQELTQTENEDEDSDEDSLALREFNEFDDEDDYNDFRVDEHTLPKLGGFFSDKSTIIH